MKTKIISRFLQILALYIFLSTSYYVLGRIFTIRDGEKINGKVVTSYKELDYSTQTSGKRYGTSHYILRPIIQYQINGETNEIHGEILGEVGKEYQIGQSVPLYYLPNQPSYAIINTFSELWARPIQSFIWSIMIFLIGTFLDKIIKNIKEKVSAFFNSFLL
ncbi:DUF3592 domain-containing protein [Leptospira biflexa]|uniref:DUF3592 domain-containing protein n=1 Tax=Leptospira biflexa TaxID=172 RepID=UPI001091803C|nr:DUF3592 domain-containing protein [Leptospira biflexa]TGM52110.1 DUF3592 domain-containing protein [Leptospira biflexa]